MPKKTIEQEVLAVTGLKTKSNEKRADFLFRLTEALDAVPDAKFDTLSEAAQEWANEAARAHQKGRPIKDFPDAVSDDDDDEDEAPAPKKTAKKPAARDDDEDDDEDEDDEPAPKSKKKASAESDDDDEDDDEPQPKSKKRARDEDEEDDEPAPRKTAKSKVVDDSDDDEDDAEDDDEEERTMAKQAVKKTANKKVETKSAKKADKAPTKTSKDTGAKKVSSQILVVQMVARNPAITTAQIAEKLEAKGANCSPSSISTFRSDSLKVLREFSKLDAAAQKKSLAALDA